MASGRAATIAARTRFSGLTALALVIGSTTFVPAQTSSDRTFAVIIDGYSDGPYTDAPIESLPHLFFVGDDVHVRVEVRNATPSPQSLEVGDTRIAEAFATRSDTAVGGTGLRLQLSDTGHVSGSTGSPSIVAWTGRIVIPLGATATWSGQAVPPGEAGGEPDDDCPAGRIIRSAAAPGERHRVRTARAAHDR